MARTLRIGIDSIPMEIDMKESALSAFYSVISGT